MGISAETVEERERAWWMRTVLVLLAPRPVFEALRDDSDAAASARQEPVTAIVFLVGVVAALLAAQSATLLDSSDFDNTLVAVWVLAAGGVQGLFGYWIVGAAVFAGLNAVGPPGRYRGARHLLAFACVPLVLSLLVIWPLRLAAFGSDVFRSGGSDHGAVAVVLDAGDAALALWAAGLILFGMRVVHEWTWGRTLAAYGLAIAAVAAIAAGISLLGF